MTHFIKELYVKEIEQAGLNFNSDPIYHKYYTQLEKTWSDGGMPELWFRLLDQSNFLSFSHGIRLGMQIILWGMGEFRRPGGDPLCQQQKEDFATAATTSFAHGGKGGKSPLRGSGVSTPPSP